MSFSQVAIEYPNFPEMQVRLRPLSNRDIDTLFLSIGELMANHARRRIAEEHKSPEGYQWAPWAESTEKQRHKGQDLLDFKGDLYRDLFAQVAPEGVEVGSSLVYAAVQQFGSAPGKTSGGWIPARPYLGVSDEDAIDIGSIVEKFFERRLGGA